MMNNNHDIILDSICNFIVGKNLTVGNRLRNDLLRKCMNTNEILYKNSPSIMTGYECFTIFKHTNFTVYFNTCKMEDPGIIHIDSNLDGHTYYTIFMNKFDIMDMEMDELMWTIDTLVEYVHRCLSKEKLTSAKSNYFKLCYKYKILIKLLGHDPEVDRLIVAEFEGCTDEILDVLRDPYITLYQLLEENMINPIMKGWIK